MIETMSAENAESAVDPRRGRSERERLRGLTQKWFPTFTDELVEDIVILAWLDAYEQPLDDAGSVAAQAAAASHG